MPETRHQVLFVCVHNSARSQMAEAFLNKRGNGRFLAESAGLEPGKMNPLVVEVMQERGIDLSRKKTQGVFDLLRDGKSFQAVITVCDGTSAEKCPVFPGTAKRISWSFRDPSVFTGSPDELLKQTRELRNEIEKAVQEFIQAASAANYWI